MEFAEIPNRSTILFEGEESRSFLQRFCTQDLRDPGRAVFESFITDVKGRSLAHGLILPQNDAMLFLTSGGTADKLVQHFDRYIIREKVQVRDRSSDYRWLALGEGLTDALPEGAFVFQQECYLPLRTMTAVSSQHCPALLQRLEQLGGVPISSEKWNWYRIESGWPEFGVDVDASNLPQEIDRDSKAISFVKGCYLGQETIARLDALGQVQKKLVRLRASGSLLLNKDEPIQSEGVDAGWVTSSAIHPDQSSTLIFAMLKRAFHNREIALTVKGERVTFL